MTSPPRLRASQTIARPPPWHRGLSRYLFVGYHASCLLAFAFPVSRKLILLAIVGYAVRMFGVTGGFHRYFSHRSFKTGRVFQFVLAWLGASAVQNGPLWWASWHRRHHKYSDTSLDPHSPLYGGLWHSHIGWFYDQAEGTDLSNVGDLSKYPELRFIERHNWLPIVSYLGVCFAVAGVPGLIWGFSISSVALLHATSAINSLSHVWGTRRFDTPDRSRNNALLALLTLGEGWHNNHHHRMTVARQGLRWWEVDVTYYVLRALAACGVVWNVREP